MRMAQSGKPLTALLQKHLKLANIQGSGIREKLQERRLVQIVSYLELVSVKLRHGMIHKQHVRTCMKDKIAMADHCALLRQIKRNNG